MVMDTFETVAVETRNLHVRSVSNGPGRWLTRSKNNWMAEDKLERLLAFAARSLYAIPRNITLSPWSPGFGRDKNLMKNS